jgi:hypothetical protein
MGSQSSSDHDFRVQREVKPYTAGIYSLLYPLFALGKMKFTPIQRKEWIISRLECLGRISGISQAFAAAGILKTEELCREGGGMNTVQPPQSNSGRISSELREISFSS